MKLFKYGLPFAALALLASCSNDNVDVPSINNGLTDADAVYFSINVTQVAATRTPTGEEGQEDPNTQEKQLGDVMVVLADPTTHNVISSAIVPADSLKTGSTTDAKKAVAGFSKKELDGLFENWKATDVFVIANPSSLVRTPMAGQAIQQVLELADSTLTATGNIAETTRETDTTKGKFLMTGMTSIGADPAPSLLDVNSPNSITNPYNLGTVKVVRAAARFDVKLADANTKFEFKADGSEATSDPELTVEFDGVALVNMSKHLNLFKEIGAGDNDSSIPTDWFFSDYDNKKENANNIWVNDPKVSDKESMTYDFFMPVGKTEAHAPIWEGYKWSNIANNAFTTNYLQYVTEQTVNPNTTHSEWTATYTPWTYVVPSTILDKDEQKNGNSTGVIFRAKMTFDGVQFDDLVYGYKRTIFHGADEDALLSAIRASEDADVKSAFAAALSAAGVTEADLDAPATEPIPDSGITRDGEETAAQKVVAKLKEAKFTKYTPDEGTESSPVYHCYYYYWNRHNDNGKNSELGNMEFGVVRNNVYKLAVTTLNKLGHPQNPGDDPDPIDPDDPDEDEDAYVQIEVQVLPWDVRVNNIEF